MSNHFLPALLPHQWCSGNMGRCHRPTPGSIPGWCKYFSFLHYTHTSCRRCIDFNSLHTSCRRCIDFNTLHTSCIFCCFNIIIYCKSTKYTHTGLLFSLWKLKTPQILCIDIPYINKVTYAHTKDKKRNLPMPGFKCRFPVWKAEMLTNYTTLDVVKSCFTSWNNKKISL